MRGLLSLLIQHVVVGVSDQRPIVSVEEHLIRNLKGNFSFMLGIWKKECAKEQRPSTKVPKMYLKVKERQVFNRKDLCVTSVNLDGFCSTATSNSAFAATEFFQKTES